MENRCKTCIYRAAEWAAYGCDYVYLTGKTRHAVPVEECKSYQKGKRLKIPRNALGAKKEGGGEGELTKPRKEQTPKERTETKPRKKPGPKWKYDWERAWSCYEAGYSDRQIGEKIGTRKETVAAWRRRNNLPPAKKKK